MSGAVRDGGIVGIAIPRTIPRRDYEELIK
jgi:hypothetical protein